MLLNRSGQNASTATIKTKRISATAICITPNCGASLATNQLAMNPTAIRSPLKIKLNMASSIVDVERFEGGPSVEIYLSNVRFVPKADIRFDRSQRVSSTRTHLNAPYFEVAADATFSGLPLPFNPRVDRCQNVLCCSPHSLHLYGTRTCP